MCGVCDKYEVCTFGSDSVKNFQPVSKIRGVFDVEEAREARESRLARGGFLKFLLQVIKSFMDISWPEGR